MVARISVLVPTYRRPGDLARCLAALQAQQRPADQLVLVVRDGDDETRCFLATATFGSVSPLVVTVARPGVVAAMNAGLAAATGEIVAITDDDAAPRADWLQRIKRCFDANPRLGGVGGRDLIQPGYPAARLQVEDVGRVRWYGRVTGNHHIGAGGPRAVDVLKGVNCAFRRHAIAPIGFDERLRGEGAQPHWELRLCLQLRRRGWTLHYDPTLIVDHFVAAKIEGGVRGQTSHRSLFDTAYNETYALVSSLEPFQATVAFLYGAAVGTHEAPGLGRLALEGVHRRHLTPDRVAASRTAAKARIAALSSVSGPRLRLAPGSSSRPTQSPNARSGKAVR